MPEAFAAVLARAGYGSALINASSDEVRGGEGQKLSGLLQQGVKGKGFRHLPERQKTFRRVVQNKRHHARQSVTGSGVRAWLGVQPQEPTVLLHEKIDAEFSVPGTFQ